MPSYKSEKGIWTPAPERAYVPPDPGKGREEGYIYEGPDRQAGRPRGAAADQPSLLVGRRRIVE